MITAALPLRIERARLLGITTPLPTCTQPHRWDKNCSTCRRRVKWNELVRATARAAGLTAGMQDAAPVAEHLRAVRTSGKSNRQMCAESGVSWTVMRYVLTGRVRQVQPLTYERLMSLQPATPTEALGLRRLVHPAGTRRRLEDLALRAFPRNALAARLDVTPASLGHFVTRSRRVTELVANRITDLHDDLYGMTGPSELTAERARAKGYLPLHVWGDRVEDPTAEPDLTAPPPDVDGPVVIEEGCVVWTRHVLIDPTSVAAALNSGTPVPPLTAAEEIDAVRTGSLPWPAGPGLSSEALAALLGVPRRRVQRIRARLRETAGLLAQPHHPISPQRASQVIYLATLPVPHGHGVPLDVLAARLGLPTAAVEERRRRLLAHHRLPRATHEEPT